MHDPSEQSIPNRSFLYWLVVPIVLAWLATNYLLGALYNKPDLSREPLATATQAVKPASVFPAPDIRPEHGMVTFWFDDAWASQYLIAEPILSAKGFKGTLAVPTSMIGYDGYANWPQIRTLQRKGWEITNHTVHHDCTMDTWNEEKVAEELQEASTKLWSQGLLADNVVSPCDVRSDALKAVARKQFLTFRGAEQGFNDLKNFDPYNLRVFTITDETSLSEVKKSIHYTRDHNVWLILVFHQIHSEDALGIETALDNREKYSIDEGGLRSIVNYVAESGAVVVVPNQALFIKDTI